MIRATLTRLSSESFPWRYAMQIKSADPPEFEYLIADLKNCVPSRQRKWDGDRRRWLFKEDVGEAVIAWLREDKPAVIAYLQKQRLFEPATWATMQPAEKMMALSDRLGFTWERLPDGRFWFSRWDEDFIQGCAPADPASRAGAGDSGIAYQKSHSRE